MSDFNQLLEIALQENRLTLSANAKEKLITYLSRLQAWNKVFNLTRITAAKDMVYLHVIDSLMMQPYLKGNHLLDVGSGAGLPGIPLAILNPNQQWVLLDKNSKKTRFLTQIIAELGLSNVKVAHRSCEDFHTDLCFNTILARALTTLCQFVTITEHLLCPNGIFLAMKGKYPQEELNDLPASFNVQQIDKLDIKGIDIIRHAVCLERKTQA